VRASLEEKEMRAFAIPIALTLTLFKYPQRTKVATGWRSFIDEQRPPQLMAVVYKMWLPGTHW